MDWIEKEITSLVDELHMAYDDERFLLGSHISLKYWIHNSLVQQALETITAASTDVPEDDVLGKKASDFTMIMGLVVSEPLFWADATEEQWNNLTLERLDSLENSVYDRMNACLHSLRWGYLDMLQSPIETRNQLEKELAQLWKISERLCTKKVASHGLSPILVLQEVNSHNLHSTFDATLSNDKHERHSPSTLFQQALNLIAVQATFLSDVIFPVCKDGCEVILDKYFTAWIQEFATGILAHRLEVVLRLDKDLLGEYIHEIKYFEDHYPSIIQPSLRVSSVLAQENIFQSWAGQDLTCVRQLVRQAIKDFERISKDELKNRHWVDLHSVSRIVSKLFTYLSDRYSFVAPYLKQDQLKFMWKELVVKGLSEFSDLLCASPIESTNLSVASLAEILQACMFLHWELRRFSDGLPFVLMKSDDPCMDYMQEYELRINSCLKKIHDIMTSRENLCLVQKYLRELDVALKWAVPRGKVLEMLDYVYLQKIFVENTWTPHTVIAVFWTPLLPRCLAAVKIITRSTTSERALYLDNRGQGSNGRPFRDVPMSSVNLLGHETILRLLSKTT